MNQKSNRLINEKSPYLLQHAHNPVDWYPWGEEAFQKAEKEDKPVFLSIGYSTCHWCHVMEKESFEDSEIAGLMNDAFINIKVDREERPDVDGIYMNVCHLLTGSGGWPLTILLTPEKKPFFAGTYFPKESRFGRIGMSELVPKLKEAWINQREEIYKSSEEITSALKPDKLSKEEEIDKTIFERAYDEYLKKYDKSYGGFGTAPKFPTPHNLTFLLRYYKRNNDPFALEMVENTLINLREGGIYDHLGFGIHRYSTDQKWKIPHFEKMLYDQAGVSLAYIETYQATGKIFFKTTAEEIFNYVIRDMTSPEGSFYSAEDADSEGEEGLFYLWTKDELQSILNEQEYNQLTSVYHIEHDGNWVDPVHGGRNGTNILYIPVHSEADLNLHKNLDNFFSNELSYISQKLFDLRKKRVHPFKDDKVLTDWNSFMISSLAKGGAVFQNDKYIDAARKAMDFLLNKMRTEKGTLLHRYREGDASITGNLDDYAFTIQALLDLYESIFDPNYLLKASELMEIQNRLFYDKEGGGYFFASSEGEELIIRQKEIYDGAVPSGNSVSILNLLRLSRFTGNSAYEEKADSVIRTFSHMIKQSPSAFSYSLTAIDFALNKSFEIVVAGDDNPEETALVAASLQRQFLPGKVILLRSGAFKDKLFKAAPFTENQKPVGGKTTIYVCSGFVCSNPVHTTEEALELLVRESFN
jgi:uncharacterized protein